MIIGSTPASAQLPPKLRYLSRSHCLAPENGNSGTLIGIPGINSATTDVLYIMD
jgi:hypothetical protein